MTGLITDPDVQALATIAGWLEGDYAQVKDAWVGSPFAWTLTKSSTGRDFV